MNVPGEEQLIGINVHFCATCDGAFYRGRKVLVVGGGNSGFEEGLFLTKFASQVDILVNSPQPKASRVLQDKVSEQKNMTVLLDHAIRELRGGKKLETVVLEDISSHRIQEARYDGVFVFIGVTPNSELIHGKAELDSAGFIVAPHMMSSYLGIFAAGDVRAGSTKQAAAAAGEGASVALAVHEYLKSLGEYSVDATNFQHTARKCMRDLHTRRPSQIVMYTTTVGADCRRAKAFFEANRISNVEIEIEGDEEATRFVSELNRGFRSVPTIVLPDGAVLVEPSWEELRKRFRL
jgi:glutaredoxin